MARAIAQLAPGGEHAHAVEEADREWPDGARGLLALEVAIADLHLALRADGTPDLRQLRVSRGNSRARTDQQRRALQFMTQVGGQHGADLGEQVYRRRRQLRVGAVGDPARAEYQRLDLLFREHQRRQHESRTEHVTQAGLAIDVSALRLQGCDVAIQRADAYLQLARQHRAAHRAAVAAQHLHELQQPFGARHASMLADSGGDVNPHNYDSSLQTAA